MPILIQQDVAGLEVQVQDVGSMQLCQPLQNLQSNGSQLMQAQGTCTLSKTLYQCSAIKAKKLSKVQRKVKNCTHACVLFLFNSAARPA